LPNNIERFVFTYDLVNGCRICYTEYFVKIGFDFDLNGKFLKITFLQIVKLPERLKEISCVSLVLSGYKVVNEFSVDFNNDNQNELVRVYAQDVEQACTAELPIVVKIFSGTGFCYKEEFAFTGKGYNLASARLMKNFWGDGRDVILLEAGSNACGSGTAVKLFFFTYQEGKYIKIDGPEFSELDYYFLSSPPEGKAILLARAKWEEGETHFGPHRYAFTLYQWDGEKYEEKEITITNNKYAIDDENFKTILQNIESVFQNEPEKLQLKLKNL